MITCDQVQIALTFCQICWKYWMLSARGIRLSVLFNLRHRDDYLEIPTYAIIAPFNVFISQMCSILYIYIYNDAVFIKTAFHDQWCKPFIAKTICISFYDHFVCDSDDWLNSERGINPSHASCYLSHKSMMNCTN